MSSANKTGRVAAIANDIDRNTQAVGAWIEQNDTVSADCIYEEWEAKLPKPVGYIKRWKFFFRSRISASDYSYPVRLRSQIGER